MISCGEADLEHEDNYKKHVFLREEGKLSNLKAYFKYSDTKA